MTNEARLARRRSRDREHDARDDPFREELQTMLLNTLRNIHDDAMRTNPPLNRQPSTDDELDYQAPRPRSHGSSDSDFNA